MSATTALLLLSPWLLLWAVTIVIALAIEHRRANAGIGALHMSAPRLPLGSVTAPHPADSCHSGNDHSNT